ncbi:MAG TPA: hypothetical protein VGW35_05660 [Methylomirabilota bacterium]|nr:hypothetical protein [Methylomirabilota bacterium]
MGGARLRSADVLAAVVTLVALGVVATRGMRVLEGRLARWRDG